MPLGNWTSQFFANIYLDELDQFVKHELKAKYYLRYVDDFIVLHDSRSILAEYDLKIEQFLETKLKLDLHPNKCQIIPLKRGICLLGFRVFYHHKIPRKRNIRKIRNKLTEYLHDYEKGMLTASDVLETLQGWSAYAMQDNTYTLRNDLVKKITGRLKETAHHQ